MSIQEVIQGLEMCAKDGCLQSSDCPFEEQPECEAKLYKMAVKYLKLAAEAGFTGEEK